MKDVYSLESIRHWKTFASAETKVAREAHKMWWACLYGQALPTR
jgi:hypothetical protein